MLRTLIAVLTTTHLGLAKELFKETGTTSDWDLLVKTERGGIQDTGEFPFDGPTCLNFSQSTEDALDLRLWNGNWAVEAQHNDGYQLGQERFYGMAFRLPKQWNLDSDSHYGIMNFVGEFAKPPPGSGLPSDAHCPGLLSPFRVFLYKGKLEVTIQHGTPCSTVKGQTMEMKVYEMKDPIIVTGKWHRLVLGVKWQADTKGSFDLFVNDKIVLTQKNIPTTVNDTTKVVNFRVGMDPKGAFGSKRDDRAMAIRWLLIDEVRVGTEKKDVSLPAKTDR